MTEITRGKYFIPFGKTVLEPFHLYIFENRDLLIINLIHSAIENLKEGRSLTFVYSHEEDLRNVVRYLNLPGWKNSFKGHRGIKTDKSVLSPGMKSYFEKLYHWIKDIEEAFIKNYNALNNPVMGEKNFREICDMLRQRKEPHVFHDLDFDKTRDTTKIYKELRSFVKEAQEKYSYDFIHLKYSNPFIKNITEKYSWSELNNRLDEFIERCRELYKEVLLSVDNINREKYEKLYEERDLLWKKYIELKTLALNKNENFVIPPEKLSAVRPIFEKVGYKLSAADGAGAILERMKSLLDNYNERIDNAEDEIAVSYEEDKSFLNRMYNNVDVLQQEIIDSGIFSNFLKAKTVGVSLNLSLLKDILGRLEAARDFVNDHRAYFEWHNFRKKLGKHEKELIEFLENQPFVWEEVFDNIFLENIFYSVHRSLHPLGDLYNILREYNQDFERAVLSYWLRPNEESARQNVIHLIKDENYPKEATDSDRVIFINYLPDSLWVPENSYIILSEVPDSKKPRSWVKKNKFKLIEKEEAFVKSVEKFSGLNSTQKLLQSLYLGQSLYSINNDHRIYELKNVSIISYMTPLKDRYLIDGLNELKIKEIKADDASQNLIPGIISKEEKTIFLLLEDGMLASPEDFTIITQFNLLEQLEEAGILIRPVFNYNFRLNDRNGLDEILSEIRVANGTYGS